MVNSSLQAPLMTDKSPQLVANQFLNERGDFGPSDLPDTTTNNERLRGLSEDQDRLAVGNAQQYADIITKNMQARQ